MAENDMPAAPVSWKITGQVQGTNVNAAGTFQEGITVNFVTGSGHAGSVFIPLDAFTVDNVRAAVAARAADLEAVGRLTSDS